jgi:hypothetical protein
MKANDFENVPLSVLNALIEIEAVVPADENELDLPVGRDLQSRLPMLYSIVEDLQSPLHYPQNNVSFM